MQYHMRHRYSSRPNGYPCGPSLVPDSKDLWESPRRNRCHLLQTSSLDWAIQSVYQWTEPRRNLKEISKFPIKMCSREAARPCHHIEGFIEGQKRRIFLPGRRGKGCHLHTLDDRLHGHAYCRICCHQP